MTIPTLDCCCDPPPGPEPRFTFPDPACAWPSPLTGWLVTFSPTTTSTGTVGVDALPWWGAGVTTPGDLTIVAEGSPPFDPKGSGYGELIPSSPQSVRLWFRVQRTCNVVSGVSIYKWTVLLYDSFGNFQTDGVYTRAGSDVGEFTKISGRAYMVPTIHVVRR